MAEIDDIFNEFARAFVGTITSDRDVAFADQLPREQLDGTLGSLQLVDSYLEFVHQNRDRLSPLEWDTTVLWGGAYVGEVIRHSKNDFFCWMDYNDYMESHPQLQQLIPERTMATCAFLVAAKS